MPNFNQKGPMGEDPMTGRKMGRCTNYGAARRSQTTQDNEQTQTPVNDGSQEQGIGRGLGRRMGRGMGDDMGQNRGGGRPMGRMDGGGGRGMGRRNRFSDNF